MNLLDDHIPKNIWAAKIGLDGFFVCLFIFFKKGDNIEWVRKGVWIRQKLGK